MAMKEKDTMSMTGPERLARAAAFAHARRRRTADASNVTSEGFRVSENLPPVHQQQHAATCMEGFMPSTGSDHSPYGSSGNTSQRAALITRASLERLRKERDMLRESNDLLQEERSAAIAERAEAVAERAEAVAETATAKAAQSEMRQQVDTLEKRTAELEAELKEALDKLREMTENFVEAAAALQKPEAPGSIRPSASEPAAPVQAGQDDRERFCVDPCVNRNPLLGRSGGFAAAKAQDNAEIRKLKMQLQDRDIEREALEDELGRMREVVAKHELSAQAMGQKLRKVLTMMGKEIISRRLMVHIVTPVVTFESGTFRGFPSRAKLERAIREEILPQCGDLLSTWESEDLPQGVSELVDQVTQDLIEGLEKHMAEADKEAQTKKGGSSPAFNIRLTRERAVVD